LYSTTDGPCQWCGIVIGVLLAIDALAYLVYGFADLLAPSFAAHLIPWTQLPALFGEGSLCLWLLLAGVNLHRWNERASAAPSRLEWAH
jgi:hypothetical protein